MKGLAGQLRGHQPGGIPEITNAQELGPLGGSGLLKTLQLPCWALTPGTELPTAGRLLALLERYGGQLASWKLVRSALAKA